MYTYPTLTSAEKSALPILVTAPEVIQSKFVDSTHRLWNCQTSDGPMVLKVCNHDAIAKSSFWDGMNHLFGVDFPNSLDQITKTHALLADKGAFVVPDCVVAKANRFVLTRFLPGKDINSTQVTDAMVIALAKHIAQLHQQHFATWGKLHAPANKAADWGVQLKLTLLTLANKCNVAISEQRIDDVLSQTNAIQEDTFVPIMLDLRWDQFREINHATIGNSLALIDLDAFATGPRTLELVLLEYILTAPQFALFKAQYMAFHDWPDYTQQKSCYQLLLFLMNVLGETDLNRWMRQV